MFDNQTLVPILFTLFATNASFKCELVGGGEDDNNEEDEVSKDDEDDEGNDEGCGGGVRLHNKRRGFEMLPRTRRSVTNTYKLFASLATSVHNCSNHYCDNLIMSSPSIQHFVFLDFCFVCVLFSVLLFCIHVVLQFSILGFYIRVY